ncbi:MAG: prepilin-type N-terminal cleavage/methylation domain-containing protein [Bacteroidales bacterium]|nr:prepilin-type N-terminal cleavage/methylation domain-containing protein [Bacteroidales bacterium]
MVALNKKLKGSTLVETIISMVIITVCLGIATVVVQQVFRTDQLRNRLNAFVIAKNELRQTKDDSTFFDEVKELENLVLYKNVNDFNDNQNLHKVEIVVNLKHNSEELYRTNKIFVNYDAAPR